MVDISGVGYAPEGAFSRNGAVIEPAQVSPLLTLLQAAALASDAHMEPEADGRWQVKGDPTEGALVVAAAKAGLSKADLDAQFPRLHEIPFTSESKRMTTVDQTPAGEVAYAKGAPEVILDACTAQLTDHGIIPLDAAGREQMLDVGRDMARQALRVLGIAFKPHATVEDAERDMTFLGLVGMIDPPRPEAKTAMHTCEQAGIKVVMITGDHPLTAECVARELGVLKHGRVVVGSALEDMSDEAFDHEVEEIDVYARVSPAHKLRVVTALQKKGHVVAMTGDGVNDAPALKKADIGIAMGITGTDVTKEAPHDRGLVDGSPPAVDRRADSVHQPRNRWLAGSGTLGRPARSRPDATPAAQLPHRDFYQAGHQPHVGGWRVVSAGESRAFRLGDQHGPERCRGHDHDLCGGGAV
jgi:Ca2+-transporting ATPase